MSLEEKTQQLRELVQEMQAQARYDLLLEAIGTNVVEQLQIQMARSELSPLLITRDYTFILTRYNHTLDLSPIHKALYLLFLNHEEGIEFKRLSDYRDELRQIYMRITNRVDTEKIEDTLTRITDPTDNAINEKCSRIKAAFAAVVDKYALRYYIITGHAQRHLDRSSRIWFERRKCITLPRHLVQTEEAL